MDDSTKLQLCLERDRLLSDPEFARSPSMCKLLRFLVDYKLSDNHVPLKSYTIATDALGRDKSFDSQTDSYPRVQMGRLRRMLNNFYLRNGGENRLTLAPNKYEIVLEPNLPDVQSSDDLIGQSTDSAIPEVQGRQRPGLAPSAESGRQDSDRRNSHRRIVRYLGAAILLALISILAYLLWPDPEVVPDVDDVGYPRVALDLPKAAPDAAEYELVETIGNHLIRGLNGFGEIRIFDTRSSQQDNPNYVIKLRFLDSEEDQIELRLLERASGEILWSEEISTANEEAWQPELNKAIIALVGNYGEITRSELSKAQNNFSVGYPCLLQFDLYIRYRDPEKLKPVRKCLQESVERYPNDAQLLSVSAFAQNMSQPLSSDSTSRDIGMLLARKAEALDHNNAAANFAVAQSAFLAGDCATGAAWGEKAYALNPLNSRISGYLGLYMIGCNMPEGESYAVRALEMDPNADLSIAAAVAFQMLKRGDAQSARQLSSEYMASSPRDEPALEMTYILSSAMLNDKREARRVWKGLAGRYGLPETSPPREVLGRWIVSPVLLDDIMRVVARSKLFDT